MYEYMYVPDQELLHELKIWALVTTSRTIVCPLEQTM